eukprot:gb/GEZN01008110.1/.p1 GENE.gb/GEZN01008110.1/~~gb/GEZN01008110.1/.p1  ORF type:complete len:411 (-),score=47.93 gb/GEZN01008110.1/:234-1439(-)
MESPHDCGGIAHGPGFRAVLSHPPPQLVIIWMWGWFSFGCVVIIWWRHYRKFVAVEPASWLSNQYEWILTMPLVFSATALVAIFVIQTAPILKLIRVSFEAYALYQFGNILRELASAEGGKGQGYGPLGVMRKQALSALVQLPPLKLYTSAPFCCFRICERPRPVTEQMIRFATRCFVQYLYTAPGFSILGIMLILSSASEMNGKDDLEKNMKIIQAFELITMLIAMYGLLILYRATHDLFKDFQTSLKFFSIKALILTGKLNEIVFKAAGVKKLLFRTFSDPRWDDKARVNLATNVAVSVESLVLLCLMCWAYPASDLKVCHHLRTRGGDFPSAFAEIRSQMGDVDEVKELNTPSDELNPPSDKVKDSSTQQTGLVHFRSVSTAVKTPQWTDETSQASNS